MQQDPLVSIAILLAAALVGGMIAHRLRQPVVLGYLLVGMAVGPHALGIVPDTGTVEVAATMGVALLMFTLGLEISVSQLKQVGRVGLWGSIAQIVFTIGLGLAVGVALFKWTLPQAILFGLVISLSSTAVCLKMLMERGELNSVHGRIMIAILIFQDVSVLGMMVALPLLSGSTENVHIMLALSLGKALLFIAAAIVSGLWVLPWLMGKVGGVRSRELFLLTVLVLGLGAAISTQIFGLSVVFGAFLIGLVLRETRFVHQALAEITPLRDIFATLFFVSLGMLLNPVFLIEHWVSVLVLVAVIIVIKLCVVYGIVRFFGYSGRISLLAGAGLIQIGEFGFILAKGGVENGIVSEQFYSLIIASAIVTMLLTPGSMSVATRLYPRIVPIRMREEALSSAAVAPAVSGDPSETANRVVIAGYGRIGQNVARGLQDAGIPYIVIDIDPERVSEARKAGKPRIYGDASNIHVLSRMDLGRAKALVVTFPDPLAVLTTVKIALEINPKLKIVARVHRVQEAELLKALGVVELISPEYEASLEFVRRILIASGWKKTEIKRTMPIVQQDEEFTEFSPEKEI